MVFNLVSGGVFLNIRAGTWVPQLQVFDNCNEDDTPSNFEDLVLINGGFLYGCTISSRPSGPLSVADSRTRCATENTILESLRFSDKGFFSGQNSANSFVSSIPKEYRGSSYFLEVLESLKED